MITKSLESFMGQLGYTLNHCETKIGGNWWLPGTVYYNEATGKWKTVNLAAMMMIEASLEHDAV